VHRISTRLYGPSRSTSWLSWIGDEDPSHRVLVHCQQGRRRSVLVAYAVRSGWADTVPTRPRASSRPTAGSPSWCRRTATASNGGCAGA